MILKNSSDHGPETTCTFLTCKEGPRDQEDLVLLRNDSPAIICSRLKESLSSCRGVDDTYLKLEEEQADERAYAE